MLAEDGGRCWAGRRSSASWAKATSACGTRSPAAIRTRASRPGDVYILNDPYIATSHQLDVAAYQPFFWEGRLFCWFFNAAHCMDIGGSQPGSFCADAKDIFDEPMTWPPIRLVHDGVIQQDVYDAFLRQSRSPSAIALNLRSQIAGLDTAARRMTALLAEQGPRLVKGVMRRMLCDTSAAVRNRLHEIPDGEWSETYLLGGLPDRRTRRLRTVLRKEGAVLIFSNEGTDPQLPTGNGTYCAFRSAAMSAVGTMLAWDQMYCPGGTLDRLRFDPHPGTFTIPSHPAGVTTVVGTNMAIALAGQVVSKMLLCGPEHLQKRALASGGLTSAGWCHAWGFDETGTLQFAPMTDSVIGALGASPGLERGRHGRRLGVAAHLGRRRRGGGGTCAIDLPLPTRADRQRRPWPLAWRQRRRDRRHGQRRPGVLLPR